MYNTHNSLNKTRVTNTRTLALIRNIILCYTSRYPHITHAMRLLTSLCEPPIIRKLLLDTTHRVGHMPYRFIHNSILLGTKYTPETQSAFQCKARSRAKNTCTYVYGKCVLLKQLCFWNYTEHIAFLKFGALGRFECCRSVLMRRM